MTINEFLNAKETVKKLDKKVYTSVFSTMMMPADKAIPKVMKHIIDKSKFIIEYDLCKQQINNLEPLEKYFIILRYKRHLTLQQSAKAMNVQERQIYRIKNKVIKKCSRIKFNTPRLYKDGIYE